MPGEIFEDNGVDQANLCVSIEVTPAQEGLQFEVVVTNVDSGVMFPPIAGEVGTSRLAHVRANLPADVTYNVLVRVGEESQEHGLEVVEGGGSPDCA